MEVEDLHFDQDYILPEPYAVSGEESNEDTLSEDVPDPRHVSRAYHPKLNGMLDVFLNKNS